MCACKRLTVKNPVDIASGVNSVEKLCIITKYTPMYKSGENIIATATSPSATYVKNGYAKPIIPAAIIKYITVKPAFRAKNKPITIAIKKHKIIADASVLRLIFLFIKYKHFPFCKMLSGKTPLIADFNAIL